MKNEQDQIGSNTDGPSPMSRMLTRAKKQFRIPISKPEVYKPLLLILSITCLQHFSGFTFTKKFLLQALAPSPDITKSIEDPVVRLPNPTLQSQAGNLTEEHQEVGLHTNEEEHTGYYYAILINVIRTVANLLMSRLLTKFRIRSLFCLSLFSTAFCLGLLGCFLPSGPLYGHFPPKTDQLMRVVILALHVFAVQFGLQSLPGQLTDTLLPSHAKPLLKGFVISFKSLSLIAFVSLITLIPENEFSAWRFWTMGSFLLVASPFLYVGVPELRHLGRSAWEFYFSSVQTVFYFVIPKPQKSRAKQALNRVRCAISAVGAFKQTLCDRLDDNQTAGTQRTRYQRQKTVEAVSAENVIATIHHYTAKEVSEDVELLRTNKLSVTFVENILGMSNWLAQNRNPERLIVARGPARCVQKNRDVGLFLFSDVMIVARKLMKNRQYRILTTINVDDKLIVVREECEVAFQNGDISYAVNFSDLANGRMWEEYANYCKEALHVNITRDKTDQAVSCS